MQINTIVEGPLKNGLNYFFKTLKDIALPASVMGGLWIILGGLRSFGYNSIILWPLNFLTGALAGLDGGFLLGGIVGKSVLLMLVSGLVMPVYRSRQRKAALRDGKKIWDQCLQSKTNTLAHLRVP